MPDPAARRSYLEFDENWIVPLPHPTVPKNVNVRLRVDTATAHGAISQKLRDNHDRKGRWSHIIGYFHDRPELLVLGFNDAGINGEGVSALCSNATQFEISFDPPGGSASDEQGMFGLYYDPDAQWPFGTGTGCESGGSWVWGGYGGADNENGTPEDDTDDYRMQWRLTKYCYGTLACPFGSPGDPQNPRELDHWVLNGTFDRLRHHGKGYFGGAVVPAYDLEHDQVAAGWEMAFGTRTTATEGLTVVRRSDAQDHAETHPNEAWFDLADPLGANAELVRLTTHPEYDQVPETEAGFRFLSAAKSGISGSCGTWSPELFKLASQEQGAEDTWVMAVPCGSVYFPPAVDERYPESWDPATAYLINDARLMVRFWNVQDPALLDDGESLHDPFAEILGTDYPNSHAIMCRAIEHEGRTLLFIADHGGRVLVYDVTDYLHTPPATPTPLATWTAPLSLTDELTNNIRAIAVDHTVWTKDEVSYDEIYVYVAVWRVGIQVLRFSWGTSACNDQSLEPVELIQTPSYAGWVHLREIEGSTTDLLVSDPIGLRAYSYNF